MNMSDYGAAPLKLPDVRMRPEALLASRSALDLLAHAYSDAYLAKHANADPWAVFFAVLQGLQEGARQALDELTPNVTGAGQAANSAASFLSSAEQLVH
jgi:hypothetical protein